MNALPLIDTHCHFDVADFDTDRAEVAAQASAAGLRAIVMPGYVAREWPALQRVSAAITAPLLLPAPGLHPCYITEHQETHLAALEQWLQARPATVAIGEIGLDYYLPELKAAELKARQQHFFRAQLALAQRFRKPVILHVRKAHADVIRILRELRFAEGGIVHAWSGSLEEAREYLRLGFRLGIGGAVTYEQARRLREVVRQVPLAALVLETDAPDMVAQAHRAPGPGRTRNSPAWLPTVLSVLAELRGESVEAVASSAWHESRAVLRLESVLPAWPLA